jgi:hypothetical protein
MSMRVKMKVAVSGARDGQSWPGIGEEIDLPDEEAAGYLAAGMAAPVIHEDVEKAVPSEEDVETRSGEDDVDALRVQAAAVGVKVDKRWGPDKLRQEIGARQSHGRSTEPQQTSE